MQLLPHWVRWSLLLGFTGAALPVKARATTRRDDPDIRDRLRSTFTLARYLRRPQPSLACRRICRLQKLCALHAGTSAPTIIVNYILRVLEPALKTMYRCIIRPAAPTTNLSNPIRPSLFKEWNEHCSPPQNANSSASKKLIS